MTSDTGIQSGDDDGDAQGIHTLNFVRETRNSWDAAAAE